MKSEEGERIWKVNRSDFVVQLFRSDLLCAELLELESMNV